MTTQFDYKHKISPDDYFNSKESCGTTIMAVQYNGGVICGADSRSTMGSFVSNRFADKLTPISEYIYCLRSGAQSDTQALRDVASYYISVYEMETDEPPLVHVAANTLKNLCYNYRDYFQAGMIVAGWDKRLGGQIYTIPLGGMIVRQPVSIGGSGSSYIFGYVDANYKENMSKDECIQFVINAISLAIARDGASGGSIRLAIINQDGVERRCVLYDDLPKFYEG